MNVRWLSCMVLLLTIAPQPSYGQSDSRLPPNLQPITGDNVERIQRVATLGRGRVHDVVWSPDGEKVAAATDTGVWLYSGGDPAAFPVPLVSAQGQVRELIYSADGQSLIGRLENSVRRWNAMTGDELLVIDVLPAVQEMAVDASANLIAAATYGPQNDATLRLFDATTGELRAVLLEQPGRLFDVAFSPAEPLLAALHEDGTIQFWDLSNPDTPIERMVLQSHVAETTLPHYGVLLFSPDGAVLASSVVIYRDHGPIHLWDTATGERLTTLEGGSGCLAFSPDGNYLISFKASLLTPGLNLWDVADVRATGEAEMVAGMSYSSHAYTILPSFRVAFSPDGTQLAISGVGDAQIMSFDEPPRDQQRALSDYTLDRWYPRNAGIESLAFSVDGTLLIAERLDRIDSKQVWDLVTLTERLPDSQQYAVADEMLSPNGDIYAYFDTNPYEGDGNIYVRDLATHEDLAVLEGHEFVDGVAFSPDGRLLASVERTHDDSPHLRLWSLAAPDFRQVATVDGDSPALDVVFSSDGRVLFVARKNFSLLSGWVDLYRITPQAVLIPIARIDESYAMGAVAISPDGTLLASGGENGVIHLWGVPGSD